MASVIETHPLRPKIDQLLIEGLSSRKIVAQLGLQYAHSVITDYKKKVFIPVARTAHKLLQQQPGDLNPSTATQEIVEATRQVSAAEPILRTLRTDKEWTDRILKGAEKDADYKGFAANMRVKQGGLRMEAELTGALDTQPQTTNNVTLVMLDQRQLEQAEPEPEPVADEADSPIVEGEVLEILETLDGK